MPAIGRRFQYETAPDRVLFDSMWSFVPQLHRYLRQRLSPLEAEDVIQDVFLRLFQRASFHTVTFPKSYLFETAHAVMIDRRRRATSRCASMHCELTDSHHPTNELSPLRILLGREELTAVEAVIDRLPTRTREIIIASRLERASLKSLAHRHQISTSAVEKHIARAVRALSAAFTG
jgi:RNA polymerase sigma factor (sigma-70 family)